jgi:hypothetical protein
MRIVTDIEGEFAMVSKTETETLLIGLVIPVGREMSTRSSTRQIKAFTEFYSIKMDDFEPSDICAYNVRQPSTRIPVRGCYG